eukprot:m.9612 g.9612  ORF g.9612 m.9612 type:complete len:300 (+) comp6966_c0_seq1:60-959(+)
MAASRVADLLRECEILSSFVVQLQLRLTTAQHRLQSVATRAGSEELPTNPRSTSITVNEKLRRTRRLYFNDTYLFEADAILVDCSMLAKGDTGNECTITLDQSIFHPQGGGQPSDTGVISTTAGWNMEVKHVENSSDGTQILHHGTIVSAAGSKPQAGDAVHLEVNSDKRKLHARLHSAGHLLDAALINLGRVDLEPSKGYHFDSGCYVEYVGQVQAEEKEALIDKVNRETQRLIDTNAPVVITMDENEAGEISRTLDVGGCKCPCGGTHVQFLSEIKSITVTRIKKVKKNVKFSYTIG